MTRSLVPRDNTSLLCCSKMARHRGGATWVSSAFQGETTVPSPNDPGFDAAVVQDASVFLDRDGSIQKTIDLAREAAENGAELVLFPEAFVPGYPRGLSFGAVVGSRSAAGRALFRRYAENAVSVPGPEVDRLAATAQELGIHLAVGVIERDP